MMLELCMCNHSVPLDKDKCRQVFFSLLQMSVQPACNIHGYLITLHQDPFSSSTVWELIQKTCRATAGGV